jgi:hypothetical protein
MRKKKPETKIIVFILVMLASSLPFSLRAQAPSSTNYRLDSSSFDFGGGDSTSTTYRAQGSMGEVETGKTTSTGYNFFSGFFPRAFPGVPGTPTFTNTGGTLYNSLDFVINTGNNTSDVNYAIAISKDNFASDINYIQINDTVAATSTWQSYINWGGAVGQRVTTLVPNTTYTIKVKARYGTNSETGFSNTAQAATVNPTLSVTVLGLGSGTAIGSFTTNATTTATSVPFSNLQTGSIKLAAQRITVTTNAAAGYTTVIQQDTNLTKTNGTQIAAVSAGNASPAGWPGGITSGVFGYHTTDSSLCTGTSNRFLADNTFAALTSAAAEISCNTGPVSGEVTNVVFKVEIEALQASGDYKNNITYITTPQY